MELFKTFKYRIYPTKPQELLIRKHCEAVRVIYNLALEAKQSDYAGQKHNLSFQDLSRQLPLLKKELPWLKECNSQTLVQALVNLDAAHGRFFKGQGGFPKFKKKSKKGIFTAQQFVKVEAGRLKLIKFKKGIKINLHRKIKGQIRRAAISFTPEGKYFAAILCKTGEKYPTKKTIREKSAIGIGMGDKNFIVTSDGQTFDSPKYLKAAEKKLKGAQREYSRQKSKTAKKRLGTALAKVAKQRKDFLHKVSDKLISENQTVCTETLKASNLLKNRSMEKYIRDQAWGMFVGMLGYKAKWRGKNVIKIGSFETARNTCSRCGWINKQTDVKKPEWECGRCQATLDRDLNASVNIKTFALKNHVPQKKAAQPQERKDLLQILLEQKPKKAPKTLNEK